MPTPDRPDALGHGDADHPQRPDVLVVSVVHGPPLVVRIRRTPLPVTAASSHTSVEGALREIRAWLDERLRE